jgi:hypothetical protein
VRDLDQFVQLVTGVLFGVHMTEHADDLAASAYVHMVVATGCTGSKMSISQGGSMP